VIEEGKEDGSFRPDINPRVFRNLFLGAFSHMTLRWFILDKGPETDKMREIDQIIELLALSVLTEEALSKGAMTN
jgi:TetR/AcrR family transcriptional regulator, fatty acid metabolism regulator protein